MRSLPDGLLPLKPADFHILMVLLEGELHGYGIMQRVEADSGGAVSLEVGSLYRLIGRLSQQGLIQEAGSPPGDDDSRRRYYRITPLGREAARAEARRLADVLRLARGRRLLNPDAPR
jgi:DNA-binding PadR family transcriptional regulator